MAQCEWVTMYDLFGDQEIIRESTENFYSDLISKLRGLLAGATAQDPNYSGYMTSYAQAIAERQWYRSRKPLVILHSGIAEMLSTTKIDIPCEECQLPFQSFVISLPLDTQVMVAGTTTNDINLPLCGIIVCEAPAQMAADAGYEGKRCLLVQWRSTTPSESPDEGYFAESLIIALEDGKTIDEQIVDSIDVAKRKGVQTSDDEIQTMYRIAIGATFLAISKDRRYVQRERIKIGDNDLCICGSGKKYKKCCKAKNQPQVGLGIGKAISIPREPQSGPVHILETPGRALQHSHVRSGHMRWQWYPSEKTRKLIFIHPLIVRPELPPRPTTPREIKDMPPEEKHYRRNVDEDLRRLERGADDPLSRQQHQWAQLRAGHITPDEYLLRRAEDGDAAALQEVLSKNLCHPSLVCKSCQTLLKQVPGATLWGQTWSCGKCKNAYKVCCGQRMQTFGRSQFGPGEISCQVCGFEKDFT